MQIAKLITQIITLRNEKANQGKGNQLLVEDSSFELKTKEKVTFIICYYFFYY